MSRRGVLRRSSAVARRRERAHAPIDEEAAPARRPATTEACRSRSVVRIAAAREQPSHDGRLQPIDADGLVVARAFAEADVYKISALDHLLGSLGEAAFVTVERRQAQNPRKPCDEARARSRTTAGQRASRREAWHPPTRSRPLGPMSWVEHLLKPSACDGGDGGGCAGPGTGLFLSGGGLYKAPAARAAARQEQGIMGSADRRAQSRV